MRWGNDKGRTKRKRGQPKGRDKGRKRGSRWKGRGAGGLPRGKVGDDVRKAWVQQEGNRAAARQRRKEGVGPHVRLGDRRKVTYEVVKWSQQCNIRKGVKAKRWMTVGTVGLKKRIRQAGERGRAQARARLAEPGFRLRWRPRA